MIIEIDIDLGTAAATSFQWIDVEGIDSISIESKMLEGGADFNTGVITILQSNSRTPGTSTGVTITAPGFLELTSTDWIQSRYISFQTTTAASTATRVQLIINTKRIEFKL